MADVPIHIRMVKLTCFWIRFAIAATILLSSVLIGIGYDVCSIVDTAQYSIWNCSNTNWKMGDWPAIDHTLEEYNVSAKFTVQYVVFGVSLVLFLYSLLLMYSAKNLDVGEEQHGWMLLLMVPLAVLGGLEIWWIGTLYISHSGSTVVEGWILAGCLYLLSILFAIGDIVYQRFLRDPQPKIV